ncbi:hypothetical protein QL285_061151 [Trifolium repens]|nr:hypothetical protein QL285_061146 [Trifolium repens]KAK2387357.1 hypothetical protein QL285_061151 [Trifolium repens]
MSSISTIMLEMILSFFARQRVHITACHTNNTPLCPNFPFLKGTKKVSKREIIEPGKARGEKAKPIMDPRLPSPNLLDHASPLDLNCG